MNPDRPDPRIPDGRHSPADQLRWQAWCAANPGRGHLDPDDHALIDLAEYADRVSDASDDLTRVEAMLADVPEYRAALSAARQTDDAADDATMSETLRQRVLALVPDRRRRRSPGLVFQFPVVFPILVRRFAAAAAAIAVAVAGWRLGTGSAEPPPANTQSDHLASEMTFGLFGADVDAGLDSFLLDALEVES